MRSVQIRVDRLGKSVTVVHDNFPRPTAPVGSEPVSSFSQLRDKTNQILADTVDVVLAKATSLGAR